MHVPESRFPNNRWINRRNNLSEQFVEREPFTNRSLLDVAFTNS